MTGLLPVRVSVLPPATVRLLKTRMSTLGPPPVWATLCTTTGAWPAQAPAVNAPVEELEVALQSVVAAAGGDWASALKLLGVYPKMRVPPVGMPLATSGQSKASAAALRVQFDPHPTSFCPTVLTHLPLLHWLSLVQKHP